MFNRWWIGLDDVGKNVAATSFVISRIGNDVDRMLMHHILERERESQTDRQKDRERQRESCILIVNSVSLHYTLVPLFRHIIDRIETERSTSGISQPGVLVLCTSAATLTICNHKHNYHVTFLCTKQSKYLYIDIAIP